MLPDQIGFLWLVPSLLGLLLWLGLIVVVVRINKRRLVRIAAIVLWLFASLFICLGAGIGANVIVDELLYQGVHNAVKEQCNANYAPARDGFWFLWVIPTIGVKMQMKRFRAPMNPALRIGIAPVSSFSAGLPP